MASNIDETELARLEALAGKSSQGPWRVDNDARTLWVGDGDERCEDIASASALLHVVDLHYIAAACNDVPALVAEVRRLRAELDVYIEEDQTRIITLQRNIIEILREKVEAWEWYEECRKCLEWLDETCCSSAPFREAEATFLAAREAVHADRE